jgi:hypothetical protein
MNVKSPRIRSLLRQADNVAAAGKKAAAEQLYRQIIEEAPKTAQAWRGLAQVARDADEREAALSQARELDPQIELDADAKNVLDLPQQANEGQKAPKEREAAASPDGQKPPVSPKPSISAAGAGAAEPKIDHEHLTEPVVPGNEPAAGDMEQLFCANHPGRQTHLRCNRCGKPICSSCANPTPVGYRCPECIREQEDVYYTATPINYLVTVLVALPLSLLIGWLAAFVLSTAFGFFLIFLGAATGTLVGRVAFRAAGRRRGRWLPYLVVACVIIGGIIPSLGFILAALLGQFSLRLIFLGIYLVTAAGATYYQMR